jgi:hypothetical protein
MRRQIHQEMELFEAIVYPTYIQNRAAVQRISDLPQKGVHQLSSKP